MQCFVGLVHGERDGVVPLSQTQKFAAAAALTTAAPDSEATQESIQVRVIANEGHFEVLDPSSATWAAVVELIGRAFAQP